MTGWTWDQVRELDLPRVEALRAAWRDNPPLAITMRLASEALGVEFKGGALSAKAGGPSPAMPEPADPYALMAQFGQAEPRRYDAPARGLPVG